MNNEGSSDEDPMVSQDNTVEYAININDENTQDGTKRSVEPKFDGEDGSEETSVKEVVEEVEKESLEEEAKTEMEAPMEEVVQKDVVDVTQEPDLGNQDANEDELDNQSNMLEIESPTQKEDELVTLENHVRNEVENNVNNHIDEIIGNFLNFDE